GCSITPGDGRPGDDSRTRAADARAMPEPTVVATDPDADLLGRVCGGGEQAVLELVRRYRPPMQRVALTYRRPPSAAEEVVQDAWIGILRSAPRFEGRSSVRTWLLRILANRARTRGAREARVIPFSSLARDDDEGPSVPADRFQAMGERHPGGWRSFP